MKKAVFLTSGGLSDEMKALLFDICGKKPQELKVLLIPTAGIETDGAREGLAICLDEFAKMGICYDNIFVYNLELIPSKNYKRTYSAHIEKPAMISRLLTLEEAKGFDVCFVSGGDASVLCREMCRTGVDIILKEAVNAGLVYVGISAGSMFAAGNLKRGLNFIANSIIPHQNSKGLLSLPEDGGDILLSDGHAVLVYNDRISMI